VADTCGTPPERWHAAELDALRAAGDQMMRDGTWERAQADAVLAYWQGRSEPFLNGDLTNWFLGR